MAAPRLPINSRFARGAAISAGGLLAWLSFISASLEATTATTTATISVFAAITLSPAPLLFGNQQTGQQVTRVITMTNASASAFGNLSITLTPPGSGDFSLSNDCGGSLAAAASCQISVTYLPSVLATASATVQVSGTGHTYTAGVTGTGVATPPAPTPVSIALSPMNTSVPDNATGGSVVSTATVTMSDGTTNFTGTLTTSDTNYYQISGMNVVLAHDLSGADDGQHNTIIGVGP